MIALDCSLVGREQSAIEQASDAMDAGEQFMGKPTGCDVTLVIVGTRQGALIGLPAVGEHRRVRVRSNTVPAVAEIRFEHAEHIRRPSPTSQPPPEPHFGQMNPSGHRSQSR